MARHRDGAETVRSLLRRVIENRGISLHAVDLRIKEEASAAAKIAAKSDRYSSYEDLQDLLGLRIITYFEDEIDQVGELLREELEIDEENSVDKRSQIDSDRFGYLSLHFIAQVKAERLQFAEYAGLSGVTFEIQVRSILQHAWAEIEHDLGYKSQGDIPRDLRRRFSRLAGLLELADQEFSALRDGHLAYANAVGEIEQLKNVGLDAVSLRAAYEKFPEFHALDMRVARALGFAEVSASFREKDLGLRASSLESFGVTTVGEMVRLVGDNEDFVAQFASELYPNNVLVKGNGDSHPPQGVGLLFLEFVIAASGDEARFIDWRQGNVPDYERLRTALAVTQDEIGFARI